MTRSLRRLAPVFALALTLSCRRAPPAPPDPAAVTLTNLNFGGDFTLTDQTGAARHLTDWRGKVVLLFFGYTTCPDVCPLTMAKIATALHSIAGAADQVQTLFVSVDVAHDTPAVLADYVKSFDVPLAGLTGTKAQIDAVVEAYHGAYDIEPSSSPTGYDVSHTTYTYLIDRTGALRYVFQQLETPERIATGVRAALHERG